MPCKALTLAYLAMAPFLLSPSGPAWAQSYCAQPVQPYCTEEAEPFEDTSDARGCRNRLERFNARMDQYQDCLARSIRQSEALQKEINEDFRSRQRTTGATDS